MKSSHREAWRKMEHIDPIHWLQLQATNYLRYGKMREAAFGTSFIVYPRIRKTYIYYLEQDRKRFLDHPEGYGPYIDEDLRRNRRDIVEVALRSGMAKI